MIDLNDIVSCVPFKHARRIHSRDVDDLEKPVHETVMVQGVPLVVEGWNMTAAWKKTMFKWDYLKRDILETVGRKAKRRYRNEDAILPRQRQEFIDDETPLYGKDLSYPEKWRETIMEKILPPVVAYT